MKIEEDTGFASDLRRQWIEDDDVAMFALRRLVGKGYTEDAILFAYRRFLELHKKP